MSSMQAGRWGEPLTGPDVQSGQLHALGGEPEPGERDTLELPPLDGEVWKRLAALATGIDAPPSQE